MARRLQAAPHSRKHVANDKPDVRRPLCEPSHVRWEPVAAIGDKHRGAPALPGQPQLLLALDAVEHLELEVLSRKPRGPYHANSHSFPLSGAQDYTARAEGGAASFPRWRGWRN